MKRVPLNIIVRNTAEDSLRKLTEFYEDNKAGLGEFLLKEVFDKIEYISYYPFAFQVRFGPYRVAYTSKFPCRIVYLIEENNIIVLLVLHASQGLSHTRKLTD